MGINIFIVGDYEFQNFSELMLKGFKLDTSSVQEIQYIVSELKSEYTDDVVIINVSGNEEAILAWRLDCLIGRYQNLRLWIKQELQELQKSYPVKEGDYILVVKIKDVVKKDRKKGKGKGEEFEIIYKVKFNAYKVIKV